MFSPEKLLGSLLTGGSRRGGANLLTSQLGMGLLGVAIEAVDHYMKKSQAQAPSAPGTYGSGVPPAAPGSAAPPPPPGPGPAASPPPPPGAGPGAGAPAEPPAGAAPGISGQSDAVLLIRAMIAAANADGAIDQEERQRILDKFQGASLSPEEHTFLATELLAPARLETIAAQVHSPELARQVYGVSLLAVTVDSEAERAYLRELGSRLGLPAEECQRIHQALGIENP